MSSDWISGFDLAEGVALLLHDAQFSEAEYCERVGWGHSSLSDAVTFARRAAIEQLVLFHHDPWPSDEELDELERQARARWNGGGPVPVLAQEGMQVVLDCASLRS